MAAASLPDWENLPDDSQYVYEAMAKLGFSEFNSLPMSDMSLVLALALHLSALRAGPKCGSPDRECLPNPQSP
jgi:hypothetical protein